MINIKKLTKSFENNLVLKGVDLTIEKGDTMVVMGASGCGKSVLLKLIIRLLDPDSGEIWIDGKEITHLSEKQMDEVRKDIGMVFQSSALFDSLTVGENVGFCLVRRTTMTKSEIAKTVAEKLEMVGLKGIENMMPSDLSGGMRKRVSLARAISMNPQIILYDEPTTGLDPLMAEEINILIKKLHDELGVTSIVVTHDMKSAFSVATKMAMLKNGEIIAVGTPNEMRSNSQPWVFDFINTGIFCDDPNKLTTR
ncbi:TPA: ABC transporter ATP-binding protein [Candidatus Poribacteria bacterium]|nr:ABC transporter ATP-binding protein [Candidatus Poribacteria bacterium]